MRSIHTHHVHHNRHPKEPRQGAGESSPTHRSVVTRPPFGCPRTKHTRRIRHLMASNTTDTEWFVCFGVRLVHIRNTSTRHSFRSVARENALIQHAAITPDERAHAVKSLQSVTYLQTAHQLWAVGSELCHMVPIPHLPMSHVGHAGLCCTCRYCHVYMHARQAPESRAPQYLAGVHIPQKDSTCHTCDQP